MAKIKPGSNIHRDNDSNPEPASGIQGVDFPEPKKVDKGKYQCTLCSEIFASREDYISHALAKINQPGHTKQSTTFHKKTKIEKG